MFLGRPGYEARISLVSHRCDLLMLCFTTGMYTSTSVYLTTG